MTLQASALGSLLRQGHARGELEAFYDHWKDERLVIDRWFMLQIATASPDTLVPVAQNLTKHAEFSIRNPNRFRSVIVAFTQNFAGFHQSSGAGYHFVADWLIQSDALNPTLSARLSGAFQKGPFNEEGKTISQRLLTGSTKRPAKIQLKWYLGYYRTCNKQIWDPRQDSADVKNQNDKLFCHFLDFFIFATFLPHSFARDDHARPRS